MKKPLIFFLSSLFISQFLFGQNPLVKQWDYRFGGADLEVLISVQQTSDGGFILGGYSNSGIGGDKSQPTWGGYDYWVVKTDALGQMQWEKNFGGTGSDDYLYCIQQTPDRGYILGGWSNSGMGGDKTQANWDSTNLSWDFWVLKIDSLGSKQWDKDFGGSQDEVFLSLDQTSDGGYILGGWSDSGISGDKTQTTYGVWDYWIIKIDSLGNKQWDKDFGGTSLDCLISVQQTLDNGFILGGHSFSDSSGNKTQHNFGTSDYWIIKTDSLGNKQWEKDIGGTSFEDSGYLLETKEKGYIIGGVSDSDSGGFKTENSWGQEDYWIIKMDSLGIKEWDKDFGGIFSEDAFGTIVQTVDEGYLITGTSYSNFGGNKSDNNLGSEQTWVLKIDTLGNKQWDKTLFSTGHDETGVSIQTKDGCYVIANCTEGGIGGDKSQTSQGYSDYWIVKFCDTTMFVSPMVNLSSTDTTFCGKQYIDFYDQSTNNPTSWQWFFPGGLPSSSTLQNPVGIYYNTYGSFDVTLIACNAAGCDTLYLPNFINEYPNPQVPTITWIADTLFCSPAYSYQWYDASGMIPGATGQYYVFQQPGNYYVIVTDNNGCATSSFVIYTGIDESVGDLGGISIIPNPSDGNFILYGAPIQSTLKIYDVAGRIIYTGKINASPEHLQLKAQDGVYFLEISSGNEILRKKISIKN